jgi:hypothetical protein
MAMILELGWPPFEIVRVTAEYSNAVLVAVLPYISDIARKLDLPVPQPVTPECVTHCNIKPLRTWGVEVGVGGTDGNWYFAFDMDFAPQVIKPAVPGIPRYMFRWDYVPEGGSFVVAAINAEVDADKGELKSLFYGDLGFGKKKPPIDVPLSCHRHRKQTRLQRVLRRRQANRRVDSGRRFQNRTAGFIGP